jgi:hypothetical protein
MATLCHRAREWSSLGLDGELSEFERALLDAHLEQCADCRAFERVTSVVTAHVRTTPLEPPSRPVRLPARRPRVLTPLRLGAAAAAAASVIGLTSFVAFLEDQPSPTQISPPYPVSDGEFSAEVDTRALRRESLKPVPLYEQRLHSLQRNLRLE